MSWDAIICDCDGVLVDSERMANRIFAEMLTALGLPMTVEEAMTQFMGWSMRTCLELMAERLGQPAPEGFVQQIQERTFAAFDRELELVPGVVELLDWLPWPCGIASSGDHAKLRKTLTKTGLYPRFAGRIFSATEVPRGKLHPDLYLYATERMGADPGRCAVVEDSVLGMQAGVAAGMITFGYAAMTDAGQLREAGAIVFTNMHELMALLS